MRLLLDLGNTRMKWSLMLQPDGWLAQGALEWREGFALALESALTGLPAPEMIVAASVVDAAREAQVTGVMSRLFARDRSGCARRPSRAACETPTPNRSGSASTGFWRWSPPMPTVMRLAW